MCSGDSAAAAAAAGADAAAGVPPSSPLALSFFTCLSTSLHGVGMLWSPVYE